MTRNELNCDLDTSVPDWIIDHPESTEVFKELGIDTSCEGKSLEYVCRQQGFEPQDVLDRLLRATNQANRRGNSGVQLWTIGHSNQPLDQFLELLHRHEIETLVDIRRFPGSRKFPHFSRENLASSVAAQGIEYQWLEGLGGRRSHREESGSDNDSWRNKSFRNYADYMQTQEFRQAFEQLVELATSDRTAIMCSESVFWRCHRRLVSDYVVASGGHVEHIFPGGQSQPHTLTQAAVIGSEEPLIVTYPGDATLFD